jgi:hypothetical protein
MLTYAPCNDYGAGRSKMRSWLVIWWEYGGTDCNRCLCAMFKAKAAVSGTRVVLRSRGTLTGVRIWYYLNKVGWIMVHCCWTYAREYFCYSHLLINSSDCSKANIYCVALIYLVEICTVKLKPYKDFKVSHLSLWRPFAFWDITPHYRCLSIHVSVVLTASIFGM